MFYTLFALHSQNYTVGLPNLLDARRQMAFAFQPEPFATAVSRSVY